MVFSSPAATPPENSGGIVLSLLVASLMISFMLFGSVSFVTLSTKGHNDCPRMISSAANIGNGLIHFILTIFMMSNAENDSPYWVAERELGGVEGPVGLMIINTIVGVLAMCHSSVKLSLFWNVFVAITGTFVPIVWPRFLSVGLSTWPYEVIFIWWFIFAMELTAVASSVTWYLLKKAKAD